MCKGKRGLRISVASASCHIIHSRRPSPGDASSCSTMRRRCRILFHAPPRLERSMELQSTGSPAQEVVMLWLRK